MPILQSCNPAILSGRSAAIAISVVRICTGGHREPSRQFDAKFSICGLRIGVPAGGHDCRNAAASGPVDVPLYSLTWPIKMSLGVYLDSLSSIMLLLITFIGAIIIRYSISYLDRDATQGRFLKWIALTLGTVLLLVVSRNLVMFTAAWMLTSFGLHQLLTHYSDRSWAVWAARKKFLISRLGDVMLLAALGLTYFCFGSVEYSEIFAAAKNLQQGSASGMSKENR